MKTLAMALAVLMFATGCMTVQHPNTGTAQYASMEACQQYNPDSPGACAKVLHQQATETAVGVGATLLIVLGYFALIALIVAGAR